MARLTKAFADGRNRLHNTADAATISDLTRLFGCDSRGAIGLANQIFEKRSEIERIFREHDAMVGKPEGNVRRIA